MSEKAVLVTIGDVRIKEYDKLNVTVERYEEIFVPIENKNSFKWKFKGYFKTIYDALKFISRNELLIDKTALNDLKSYLEQVEKSNEELLKVVCKS